MARRPLRDKHLPPALRRQDRRKRRDLAVLSSYSQAMSTVLRAVRRADGSYRITLDPPVAGVDAHRAYTAAEVEQLAVDLGAELRWVTPPELTRSADLWGGPLPPGDEN
jgi:hypothetical protein